MTKTPMIQPAFQNESIFPRRDQIIMSWLWEAIVQGSNQQTSHQYFSLTDVEELNQDPELLHVIMDGRKAGLYWSGEYVCDEFEVLNATAALLALRGRTDLIYQDDEAYDRTHPQGAVETVSEDDLGDLDEHPF